MNAKAKRRKQQRQVSKQQRHNQLQQHNFNNKRGNDDEDIDDETTTAVTTTKTTSPSSSLLVSKFNNSKNNSSNTNRKKKFLTPSDGIEFDELIQEQYQGFVHIPANQVQPSSFQSFAKSVFERLRDTNYYQYDIVKAGGKHSSRTFVKRTLVGNPGITYKYLGLRLFAHAWSGPTATPLLKSVGKVNQIMIDMTAEAQRQQKQQTLQNNEKKLVDNSRGGYDYNLTLINYMEPTSHTKVGFKEETAYGMGKVSVSWHADSSLEPYSSIGVYHCLPTQKSKKWDWKIALRRNPPSSSNNDEKDSAKTLSSKSRDDDFVLPVVVPTKDGDVYFLMNTFNHTHQHSVLAGSEASRISSTHRVAVTATDTYQYISKRAQKAILLFQKQLHLLLSSSASQKIDATKKWNETSIHHCQQVLSEVEFEWIAQYWLQGQEHHNMHTWWQSPMQKLEECWWMTLEEYTFQLYQACCCYLESSSTEQQQKQQRQPKKHKAGKDNNIDIKNSSRKNYSNQVPHSIVQALYKELQHRQKQRQEWDERRADKIYQRRIQPPFRPVERPSFAGVGESTTTTQQKRLPKDLRPAIQTLSKILQLLNKKEERHQSQKSKNKSNSNKNKNNNNKNGHEEEAAKEKRPKKKRKKNPINSKETENNSVTKGKTENNKILANDDPAKWEAKALDVNGTTNSNKRKNKKKSKKNNLVQTEEGEEDEKDFRMNSTHNMNNKQQGDEKLVNHNENKISGNGDGDKTSNNNKITTISKSSKRRQRRKRKRNSLMNTDDVFTPKSM